MITSKNRIHRRTLLRGAGSVAIGLPFLSAMWGLSTSLGMHVFFRVHQGFCGGPMLPLSQTLLLQIFPKEKQAAAMGLWAMTTLLAPICGPMLGGFLT